MMLYKKPKKKMLIGLKRSIQRVISSRFAWHSNLCYLFNTQKSGEFSSIIICWLWQGAEERPYSVGYKQAF